MYGSASTAKIFGYQPEELEGRNCLELVHAEDRDHRFVRLPKKREIPGTRLGLAVCKRIVEGLGGVIWVATEPGAGSTFSFTIAAPEEKKPIRSAHPSIVMEMKQSTNRDGPAGVRRSTTYSRESATARRCIE